MSLMTHLTVVTDETVRTAVTNDTLIIDGMLFDDVGIVTDVNKPG